MWSRLHVRPRLTIESFFFLLFLSQRNKQALSNPSAQAHSQFKQMEAIVTASERQNATLSSSSALDVSCGCSFLSCRTNRSCSALRGRTVTLYGSGWLMVPGTNLASGSTTLPCSSRNFEKVNTACNTLPLAQAALLSLVRSFSFGSKTYQRPRDRQPNTCLGQYFAGADSPVVQVSPSKAQPASVKLTCRIQMRSWSGLAQDSVPGTELDRKRRDWDTRPGRGQTTCRPFLESASPWTAAG